MNNTNVAMIEQEEDIAVLNLVDEKTYEGENMTSTEKEPETKSQIKIGLGKNHFFDKSFNSLLKEYAYECYLKFSLDNKQLLDYIYRYFDYNRLQQKTLSPTKGWLVPGASVNARRPNMYFKSIQQITHFLDYLSMKVDLIEIKSGVILSDKNQRAIIQRRVN